MNVSVLDTVPLSDSVFIGEGSCVDPTALVGAAPMGARECRMPTTLGSECVIRSHSTIYAGSTLGDRVQTGHGALIRERNVVGSDVSIGTNTVLEPGNVVGDRVRIHSGCFLELVTLEDDVFVGPNVAFADDLHPPCPSYEQCVGGAVVRRGAAIGANATVLPGVEIGRNALVGAGSVVVSDVPANAVVVGNPARVVCEVGDLVCSSGRMSKPYSWAKPL